MVSCNAFCVQIVVNRNVGWDMRPILWWDRRLGLRPYKLRRYRFGWSSFCSMFLPQDIPTSAWHLKVFIDCRNSLNPTTFCFWNLTLLSTGGQSGGSPMERSTFSNSEVEVGMTVPDLSQRPPAALHRTCTLGPWGGQRVGGGKDASLPPLTEQGDELRAPFMAGGSLHHLLHQAGV